MSENFFEDVAALLRTRGWSVAQENPSGADLWSLDGRSEMYLPPVVRRGSFEWSDLVERIAAAHEIRAIAVERDIELVRYDITRFRVDDGPSDGHTVPLEAGAAVVSSAFGMLRAAATAARRPRQSIGSNYSKLGDEIVREARLAHTEHGSFVFPVILKVSAPEPPKEQQFDGINYDSMPPESPERRVTRTLAQAMAAFDKHILQPGKDPRTPALNQVVIAGGTKEMLAHVSKTLAEPGVSWFETGFTWSPVEKVDKNAPSSVLIPADSEARELVSRSVRALSTPQRKPLQIFTGPIIHISHAPDDIFGEIAIQTPLQGSTRLGRIELQVPKEQLGDIHDWMNTAKTVVVQGTVVRAPGRPARIEGVSNPTLLEEAMLFTENDQN